MNGIAQVDEDFWFLLNLGVATDFLLMRDSAKTWPFRSTMRSGTGTTNGRNGVLHSPTQLQTRGTDMLRADGCGLDEVSAGAKWRGRPRP